MDLLLDTHIWLWTLQDERKKLRGAYDLIISPKNRVLVSTLSLMEVYLKEGAGKLTVPVDLEEATGRQAFVFLPLDRRHVSELRKLPLHHRDPFDRAILCQASADSLTLVTADEGLRRYSDNVLMLHI